MTPDTFRHSPEILPGRRLRLEKIHARHAPALYASVRRSMPELDYIAWGHQRWRASAATCALSAWSSVAAMISWQPSRSLS